MESIYFQLTTSRNKKYNRYTYMNIQDIIKVMFEFYYELLETYDFY